jgi:predicted permease
MRARLRQVDLGPGLTFFMQHIELDGTVLLLSAAAVAVAGVIAGLLPAWFTRKADLVDALRSGSRAMTLSPAALRWQQGMVFAQAGLSVVILTAAALLGVSFRNLSRVPAGFDARDAVVARIQLQDKTYATHEQRTAFARAFLDKLSREPALAAHGFTSTLPVGDVLFGGRFFVEAADGSIPSDPMLLHIRRTSWNYLQAIGIPLVAGRPFDAHDDTGAPPVAIVSRTLAERLWPGQTAVGKRIYRAVTGSTTPSAMEIVGVAGAVMDAGFNVPAGEAVYLPFTQVSTPRLSIIVRPRADRDAALTAIRHALRATDPVLAANGISTLETLVQQANALPRLQSMLLLTFAIVALGIVALGSYGVMSQLVANREREYALRLVFGAAPAQLGRSVFAQMARFTIPGVATGVVGVVLLGGVLRRFVFGIEPRSVGVLLAVSVAMVLVALVATLPSALRAMRVDVRTGMA